MQNHQRCYFVNVYLFIYSFFFLPKSTDDIKVAGKYTYKYIHKPYIITSQDANMQTVRNEVNKAPWKQKTTLHNAVKKTKVIVYNFNKFGARLVFWRNPLNREGISWFYFELLITRFSFTFRNNLKTYNTMAYLWWFIQVQE